MYLFKLSVRGDKIGSGEFFEDLEYYLQSLYMSDQIINDSYEYEPVKGGLSILLTCPEKDSFDEKNCTIYAKGWRKKIEIELECEFVFKYIGNSFTIKANQISLPTEYIIFKKWHYSPLIDGLSREPVPLYKIPYTREGECYDDINFWENNYDRVTGLWFNGYVGERWAQNQLQRHDSQLSDQGINCCKKIEEVTNIPTYYFLFNYRSWGKKKDRARKCPSCGGDWFVEDNSPGDDTFNFRCDDCRLISELSPNSSNN